MIRERTQVAIIGAGPAGLLLGQLLHRQGIEAVIIEARSRAYAEARIRAGVLEQGTIEVLREAGVGERMDREGLPHGGIYINTEGQRHHIPMTELTGGRGVMIYGQTEVVKDLIAARLAADAPLHFECNDVIVEGITGGDPVVRFTHDGDAHELHCELIAGCDGFHGVCRTAIPDELLQTWGREYPFAWLGILADVAPSTDELIYAQHERGFALHSMRSPTVSRLYIQVDPDEDIANWSDDRIWSELHERLATDGWELTEGPVMEKSITPMRSFVAGPMRHGRLTARRRRRPHRAAHGGQGPQPRRGRRHRAGGGDDRALRPPQRHRPGRVLRSLHRPGVAGPALLVVDDHHAPPGPGGR